MTESWANMKRLTHEGNFCDIVGCKSTPGGSYCENGTCVLRALWERLQNIEDILGDNYDLGELREREQASREDRLFITEKPYIRHRLSEWEKHIRERFERSE